MKTISYKNFQLLLLIILVSILHLVLVTSCNGQPENNPVASVILTIEPNPTALESATSTPNISSTTEVVVPKVSATQTHQKLAPTITQEQKIQELLMLDFTTIPKINGTLFLNDQTKPTKYLAIDFIQKEGQIIQLPAACQILTFNNKAICFDPAGLFIFDLQTKVKEIFACPIDTGSWLYLTPSNTYLYYANWSGLSDKSIGYCNLKDRIFQTLIDSSRDEWLYPPKLSDSGRFLLGPGKFSGYLSQSQYALLDLNTMTKKIIYYVQSPYAVNDISWAHNLDVVIIGAQDSDIQIDAGYCSNHLFGFEAIEGKLNKLVDLPPDHCFDMFDTQTSNLSGYLSPDIWSPDNRKIALTMDNGTKLCIIQIEGGKYKCYPIPAENERIIWDWVWSPDSKWLAFLTSGNHLVLFSTMEEIFLPLADLKFKSTDLVWTEAIR